MVSAEARVRMAMALPSNRCRLHVAIGLLYSGGTNALSSVADKPASSCKLSMRSMQLEQRVQ